MKRSEEEEATAIVEWKGGRRTEWSSGMGLKMGNGGKNDQMPILSEMIEKQLFEGLQGVKSWRVKNERWQARRDLSKDPKFGKNGVFRKNTQFFY